MTDQDHKETRDQFHEAVNMSAATLTKWLQTEESRSVGMTPGGDKVTSSASAEAVGHHMGERIVAIKGCKQADLTHEDYADMRKVIGYVHRHLAQKPTKGLCQRSRHQ